jgi:hypothetical protein
MAHAQLSLIPELAPALAFDGVTYNPQQDGRRLASQFTATRDVMLDYEWRTLAALVLALRKRGLHVTEASISARIRDLRKAKFGGYNVERRRLLGGLWEYRIAPAVQA